MNDMIANFNRSVTPLYSKGKKGEIRVWQVSTNGAHIVVEHGMLGGRTRTSLKLAKGKNIGRSNETTPAIQAVLQAKSMYKKQVDKGYFPSVEEAKNTVKILPMLADKFQTKKHKISYPASVQPKLDGVRCTARWENGELVLRSRGGKIYDIAHISEACKQYLDHHMVFDGEVYIHGVPLNEINSMVKKPRFESRALEYHMYDMFHMDDSEQPWVERLEELENTWASIVHTSPIKPVLTFDVNSEFDALEAEATFLSEGYEGAIVRDYSGSYLIGKRSSKLLKIKSFEDSEFEIVGFVEGVDKYAGCVTWVCKTKEGKTFNSTPKGTLEQKREWFQNGNDYIGKMLTIRYIGWTKEGKPNHNVGIAIRLEEDM